MKELLLKLLLRLEAIGEENEEIGDTVCHDAMSEAVFRAFLVPERDYEFPDEFGLCGPEADLAVRDALLDYVNAARELAPAEGLLTFQQRLAAFQDCSVFTEHGGSTTDDFFGGFAASMYSENGEWLGDEA